MNRRGALELSITAIVVLIIAITVLGLGIGFIKKQFTAGTELVGGQFDTIRQQLREQLRTSGDLLVFSVPSSVSIGKPQKIYVGVKNTVSSTSDDRSCFRLEVKCIKPFTFGEKCTAAGNNVVVGGINLYGQPAEIGNNWFSRFLGEFDLRNNDADGFESEMLVRGIKPDSYSMEINVFKHPDDKRCVEGDSTEFVPYASKTFTLDVI